MQSTIANLFKEIKLTSTLSTQNTKEILDLSRVDFVAILNINALCFIRLICACHNVLFVVTESEGLVCGKKRIFKFIRNGITTVEYDINSAIERALYLQREGWVCSMEWSIHCGKLPSHNSVAVDNANKDDAQ